MAAAGVVTLNVSAGRGLPAGVPFALSLELLNPSGALDSDIYISVEPGLVPPTPMAAPCCSPDTQLPSRSGTALAAAAGPGDAALAVADAAGGELGAGAYAFVGGEVVYVRGAAANGTLAVARGVDWVADRGVVAAVSPAAPATTFTLAATAAAADGAYVGWSVVVRTGDTRQRATVTAYTAGRVATVDRPLSPPPAAGASTYALRSGRAWPMWRSRRG